MDEISEQFKKVFKHANNDNSIDRAPIKPNEEITSQFIDFMLDLIEGLQDGHIDLHQIAISDPDIEFKKQEVYFVVKT